MYGILFAIAAALVLYGLISSTDKVLTIRQQHIKIDERMTEHRSRM